jgi:hypothetical protein
VCIRSVQNLSLTPIVLFDLSVTFPFWGPYCLIHVYYPVRVWRDAILINEQNVNYNAGQMAAVDIKDNAKYVYYMTVSDKYPSLIRNTMTSQHRCLLHGTA